ncbi:glycoside hydrolase family 25 protein [Enhygromyxa salina]|uniref:Lysozyme M1 n=1 Tax=Enhygromyxa salina TaxID=215803 RepID=A0A2S9YWH0_9BACT|nr:glycoside hydrolase family 25 protein [Enhygromyxa salina]PRQ09448.1 Lysozyme M1 precursor [Enhygromyxa salina]
MFPCQGVDVSSNQGDYDWDAAVRDGNIKFAVARNSIGYNTQDTHFAKNWAALAQRGILRGAYHFAYPESVSPGMTPAEDAQQEAGYFCDLVLAAEAQVNPGQPMFDGKTLPAVLDYEQKPSLSHADQRAWVNAWITTTQSRLRRSVIIYSGPNTWTADFEGDPWLTNLPFWIAHYSNGTAPNISPWSRWVFWQWSGGGSGDTYQQLTGSNFPGVPNGGAVDINAFWGSEAQLNMLGDPSYDRWLTPKARSTPTPTPTPTIQHHIPGRPSADQATPSTNPNRRGDRRPPVKHLVPRTRSPLRVCTALRLNGSVAAPRSTPANQALRAEEERAGARGRRNRGATTVATIERKRLPLSTQLYA